MSRFQAMLDDGELEPFVRAALLLEARWEKMRQFATGMLNGPGPHAAAFCRILLDYMQQLEREGGGE